MYRITVQNVDYTAPDFATLQRWVDEGRVLQTTYVWVESGQRYQRADEIDGLRFNPGPPNAPYIRPIGDPVPNNLFLAIFSTLCCCLPFGVVSIVYAAQVDGHYRNGNRAQALEASEKAKNWALGSIACGVLAIVIRVLIAVSVHR